jgi:regulator of RNase E activity RraA
VALKPDTIAKLKTVSTATLTTALFKRGLRNQFIQDVHRLNPQAGPMVGEAFTLRYIPAREDLNQLRCSAIPRTRSGRPSRRVRQAR